MVALRALVVGFRLLGGTVQTSKSSLSIFVMDSRWLSTAVSRLSPSASETTSFALTIFSTMLTRLSRGSNLVSTARPVFCDRFLSPVLTAQHSALRFFLTQRTGGAAT